MAFTFCLGLASSHTEGGGPRQGWGIWACWGWEGRAKSRHCTVNLCTINLSFAVPSPVGWRGGSSFFPLTTLPAPPPALSQDKLLQDIEELGGGEGTHYKDGTLAGLSFLPPVVSLSSLRLGLSRINHWGWPPCSGREVGSRRERVKSFALSVSCLQKRNKSGLGGRMPGSLGWGVGSKGCWMCLS